MPITNYEESYRVEMCTYRYLLLLATLAMSIIFLARSVRATPQNIDHAITSAQYAVSPLVIGWFASFFIFRYRYERTIKDNKSLVVGIIITVAVTIASYCSNIDWSRYEGIVSMVYVGTALLVGFVGIALVLQVMRYADIFRVTDEDSWLNFITQLIIYIPCLIEDGITYLVKQYQLTARPILILFVLEIILLILFFTLPALLLRTVQSTNHQGFLLPGSLPLSIKTILSDSSVMRLNNIDKKNSSTTALLNYTQKYNQNYAFSFWVYLNKYDNGIQHQQRNIFNYGNEGLHGKPCLYIQSSQVYAALSNRGVDVSTIPLDFQAQKWNNLVFNYRFNQVDVFLNGELVKTMTMESNVPVMSPDDIVVVGDNRGGIHGAICNLMYHDKPMTKMEITTAYNWLHLMNPPVIPGVQNSHVSVPSNMQSPNNTSPFTAKYWSDKAKDTYNKVFPKFVASINDPLPRQSADNSPPFTGFQH